MQKLNGNNNSMLKTIEQAEKYRAMSCITPNASANSTKTVHTEQPMRDDIVHIGLGRSGFNSF